MSNHIQATEYNCCGCAACKNICPQKAITMIYDKKGFEYPIVDTDLCTDCGLCIRTCPLNDENGEKAEFQQEVYAVINADTKTREKSTSGGAFSLIANYVLDNDGKVYGANLDDSLNIKHISVETASELDKLRGSKYVQSSIGTVFSDIKEDLSKGRFVLFCGSPCHVHGLLKFIPQKLKKNLITVDFVCHGVPSPKLWKDYVEFLQKKQDSRLVNYKFRSKIAGWHTHIEEAEFENGKVVYNAPETYVWDWIFHKNMALRSSCYQCKYTTYDRVSDITIGDFWGIESVDPKMDDNCGTSLVLVNTESGKEVFDVVSKNAICKMSDSKSCKQQALYRNATCKYDKDLFWNEYTEKGFEYIVKKYVNVSKKRLLKMQMIILLNKTGLLNIIYKLLHK